MNTINSNLKWVFLLVSVVVFMGCSDKNSPAGPDVSDATVSEYWNQVPAAVSQPDSSSTTTPSAIKSLAPGSESTELIVNGSFETGNFAGWQIATTGSPFSPWRVIGSGFRTYSGITPTEPQDGNLTAVNGFDGGGPFEFRLWQTVTIPSGSANLSWKYRAQWNFGLGGFASLPRTFEVQLRDVSTGNVLATVHNFSTGTQSQSTTGNTGFISASADLSDYSGQTVNIYFIMGIPQSSTGPAMFELDDISLQGGGETFTYTSQAGIQTFDPIIDFDPDTPGQQGYTTGEWVNQVCHEQTPRFGLDANWVNPHDAFKIADHPYIATTPALQFEADWIHAIDNLQSSATGGPNDGQNWTLYQQEIQGDGDFVIQQWADNCSWVFLDDQLIGQQNNEEFSAKTPGLYGVSLEAGITYTLSFIIFDGGGLAGGKFRLETTESFGNPPPAPIEINNAPVANAGADQSLNATGTSTSVTLDGSGSSDPDGDALTYSWSLNGSQIATGVSPSVNLPRGTHTITLTVTDPDGATDTDDVDVNVLNNEPVANAGSDQSHNAISPLTSVTLDGSGSSDPDGDPLTYSWSLDGTEIATGVSPTIQLGLGTHTITLTVSCPAGDTDTDEVVIEIFNNPPVANAGADQALNATNPLTSVSLNGSGSSDPDGNPLTYSWSLNGSEIATGANPTVQLGLGTHAITLTVADPLGDTSTDEVVVEIINNPPVANAGADQSYEATGAFTNVTLNGSGSSDPNGDAISYSWSIEGNEVATGAAPNIQLPLGIHTVRLTVTDEHGASATDDGVVNIVDTTAPELSYNVLDTSLWPPNHKMRLVVSGVLSSDIADANTVVDITVKSNEAINGQGDGNTDADWEVQGGDVLVRAERSGNGNGRIYTITITGSDASGNATTEIVEVTVPHDQGKKDKNENDKKDKKDKKSKD